jgi:uncharacterized damage-inducible protein DinB
MTIAEILLADFDIEIPMTRRMIERVPDNLTDYKPHEKSMPLGKLAAHVATIPFLGNLILTTTGCDAATASFPDATFHSPAKLLTDFDTFTAATRSSLAASSNEALAQPWPFRFRDFLFSNKPRCTTFSHVFLGHLIHHRAQLGVYLRLNDIAIPGVYGPSADEGPKPVQ